MNTIVTRAETVDSAADAFENIFRSILNHHAPVKTFHMRRNYNPRISEDTKDLIRNRNALKEEGIRTKCSILKKEFNLLCKEVKKAVAKDEKEKEALTTAWTQQRSGELQMNF